jgi:hypothetical protein
MSSILGTKEAWRVIFENNWEWDVSASSGAGIFAPFGQSNCASAVMGLIGLMNVSTLEGAIEEVKLTRWSRARLPQ